MRKRQQNRKEYKPRPAGDVSFMLISMLEAEKDKWEKYPAMEFDIKYATAWRKNILQMQGLKEDDTRIATSETALKKLIYHEENPVKWGYIANAHLIIEQALKTVVRLLGETPERTHKLLVLLKQIDEKKKSYRSVLERVHKEYRRDHPEHAKHIKKNLDESLSEVTNCFLKLEYNAIDISDDEENPSKIVVEYLHRLAEVSIFLIEMGVMEVLTGHKFDQDDPAIYAPMFGIDMREKDLKGRPIDPSTKKRRDNEMIGRPEQGSCADRATCVCFAGDGENREDTAGGVRKLEQDKKGGENNGKEN